jgi:hypothetical protein
VAKKITRKDPEILILHWIAETQGPTIFISH